MARNGSAGSPRRAAWLVGFGVVAAAIVSVATVAFACSPQCCAFELNVLSGAPGTQVVAHGTMYPGTAATEIRWGGVDGPVLATAPAATEWWTPIAIPQADPGYYFVTSVPLDPTGTLNPARRSVTFKVTRTKITTTEASASPVAAPALADSTSAEPSIATEPAAQPTPANEQPAALAPALSAPVAGAAPGAPGGAPGADRRQPAVGAAPGIPAAVAVAAPGQPVPVTATPAADTAPAPTKAEPAPEPWSGRASLEGGSGLDGSGRGSGPLGAGLVVLGMGSIALFGGVVIVAARRTRIKAR